MSYDVVAGGFVRVFGVPDSCAAISRRRRRGRPPSRVSARAARNRSVWVVVAVFWGRVQSSRALMSNLVASDGQSFRNL